MESSVNGNHETPAVAEDQLEMQTSPVAAETIISNDSSSPSSAVGSGSGPTANCSVETGVAASHLTINGCVATPSPRAPTSAGDVHEEFFGDDPLPDADWEQRSVHVDSVPQDMSSDELRRLMVMFGPVEDVQLIADKDNPDGPVTGHVVFRLQSDAEVARRSVTGKQSLITLRELNCGDDEQDSEEDDEHGKAKKKEELEEKLKETKISVSPNTDRQQNQHSVQRGAAIPRYSNNHHIMQMAPQLSYGRNMMAPPHTAPFLCHPQLANGPWAANQGAAAAAAAAAVASFYYPLSAPPIYGSLPSQHGPNYILSPPQPQAVSNTGPMPHRKPHRGLEDGDGPCVRLVVHTRLVGAIIGVGGATIRRITRHQVRVDVDNNIMKRPWPPSTGRHSDTDASPACDDLNASNGNGTPRSLQSQVVFIYGAQEAVERAVQDIMQLVQREARSKKLEHEPDLALLVDNALCGRIIGKGGHKIKRIRENTEVDIVLCNETIIRYEDAYHVYLSQCQYDLPSLRIISIRGELDKCLEAFRQLVTSINEIRRRSPLDVSGAPLLAAAAAAAAAGGHMGPLAGFLPGRPMAAVAPAGLAAMRQPPASYPHYLPMQKFASLPGTFPPRRPTNGSNMTQSSPVVEKESDEGDNNDEKSETGGGQPPTATPHAVHLDLESLYVLVPNSTGGAIIGTEGRNIHKIMEMTAASVTVSKHQPVQQPKEPDEGDGSEEKDEQKESVTEPTPTADEAGTNAGSESKRLVTIRANSEQSLDLALHFIFRKVQSCRRDCLVASRGHKGMAGGPGRASVPLIYTVMRIPKALMGRLCGRHHQNVATIQRQSNALIEISKPWFTDLLPSNAAEDNDGTEFDNIFIQGDLTATQLALVQLRARLLEAFYAYSQQHGLALPYASYPAAAMAAAASAAPTFGGMPHGGLTAHHLHPSAIGMYPSHVPHHHFPGIMHQPQIGSHPNQPYIGLVGSGGSGTVMYRHLTPTVGQSIPPPRRSNRPTAQNPQPQHEESGSSTPQHGEATIATAEQ